MSTSHENLNSSNNPNRTNVRVCRHREYQQIEEERKQVKMKVKKEKKVDEPIGHLGKLSGLSGQFKCDVSALLVKMMILMMLMEEAICWQKIGKNKQKNDFKI